MAEEDQEMMMRMTRLETLMEGVRESQSDIKEMLKQVLTIQETVTRHSEILRSLQENGTRTVDRLDSHSEWQKTHERQSDEATEKLNQKLDLKLDELWKYSRGGFAEVATFNNRLRGGMVALCALMSIMGTICMAGGTWLISTANEAQQINRLQAQELAELRRMVTKEGR